tara:strand:+ start:1029 stop:1472 length:444 start_codon:yes stop_codon:yes gene_type:complete
MNYKNRDNMKNLFTLLFLFISMASFSQQWVNDLNFEEKVTGYSAYEDHSNHDVIIVEFWAEFNKDNAFKEWKKLDNLDGVKYYRIDIATSPKLKKELRIRMAPTILLYIRGDAYIKFTAKAGLDLKCPVDYNKMLRAIEIVKQESSY